MDRRYDVLLCDADNTIFDFTKAEENAFAIACAHAGIDGAERLLPVYADINSAMWKLLELGGITQSVLRVRRFEQFLAAIARADIDAAGMSAARELRVQKNWQIQRNNDTCNCDVTCHLNPLLLHNHLRHAATKWNNWQSNCC